MLVTEIDELDCVLAILIPLSEISLQSHPAFSLRLSSEIPLRCIKTMVARIAGAVTTKLSVRSKTIFSPKLFKVS